MGLHLHMHSAIYLHFPLSLVGTDLSLRNVHQSSYTCKSSEMRSDNHETIISEHDHPVSEIFKAWMHLESGIECAISPPAYHTLRLAAYYSCPGLDITVLQACQNMG